MPSVGRSSNSNGFGVIGVSESRTAERASGPPESIPYLETNRWYRTFVIALVFGAIGVAVRSPGLLLCAGVALAYLGAARIDRDPPTGAGLELSRELEDPLRANDEVDVTVTVTNAGGSFVPGLRLVDGVPDAIEVVDGSPRFGTALRPGESVEFEYTVAVARGVHEWETAVAVLANGTGSKERTTTLGGRSRIECPIPAVATGELPVRRLTTPYAGRVRTESGGSGVAFYALREYRRGDPLGRIDWKRLARTGELSTIEFHEERGVSAVLLIDARKAAYRAPGPGALHAVDRSVQAAGRIFDSLLDGGNRAGIAVFGREDAWFPPGAGAPHRARARQLLAEHPALAAHPPDRERYHSFLDDRRDELLRERVETLHRRLPSDAQVFCLSPCCDNYVASVAHHLDAHGHLVTVVSPDPTASDTPGRQLARLTRDHRLRTLNRLGIPVIDWGADESLDAALERAATEASRRVPEANR